MTTNLRKRAKRFQNAYFEHLDELEILAGSTLEPYSMIWIIWPNMEDETHWAVVLNKEYNKSPFACIQLTVSIFEGDPIDVYILDDEGRAYWPKQDVLFTWGLPDTKPESPRHLFLDIRPNNTQQPNRYGLNLLSYLT